MFQKKGRGELEAPLGFLYFQIGLKRIRNVLGICKLEEHYMKIPPTKNNVAQNIMMFLSFLQR